MKVAVVMKVAVAMKVALRVFTPVTVLLYKEQPFHVRVRFANIRISGGQVQDLENSESRYPLSQKPH